MKYLTFIYDNKYLFFIVVVAILTLESFILGPYSYLVPGDNSDGAIPAYLWLSNALWKYHIFYWTPHMAAGVDRLAHCMQQINFTGILFSFLPGYFAYQFIFMLRLFVTGFFSYKLTKEFLGFNDYPAIITGVALCFISVGWASSLVQGEICLLPLMLWLIERLYGYKNNYKYLYCFLLGIIYSFLFGSMAISLPFTLPFMFVWFFFIRQRQSIAFIVFISIFFLGCIIAQIEPSMAALLNQRYSHRLDRYMLHGDIVIATLFYNSFCELGKELMSKFYIVLPAIYLLFCKSRDHFLRMIIALFFLLIILNNFAMPATTMIQNILGTNFGYNFDRFAIVNSLLASLIIGYFIHDLSIGKKMIYVFIIRKQLPLAVLTGFLFMGIFFTLNIITKKTHIFEWLAYGSYTALYKSPQIKKLAGRIDIDNIYRADVIGYSMQPNYLHSYGLETAGGYLNMYPKTYKELWLAMNKPFFAKNSDISMERITSGFNRLYFYTRHTPIPEIIFDEYYKLNLASLLNIKYFISEIPIINNHLVLIDKPSELTNNPTFKNILVLDKKDKILKRAQENFLGRHHLYIYENLMVFPRFFLTNKIRYFNNNSDLLKAMANSSYKSLRETTFMDIYNMDNKNDSKTMSYKEGTIEVQHYSPDTIVLSVKTDGEAILVVSNSYSPYWKCSINGKEERVYKVDYTFWGIYVPPGESIIKFTYEPPYRLTKTS